MPKLASIAITTSKSEKYLDEQIQSLFNQTYKNIEIVASHDECGDNTINLLKKYANENSNFKYFLNSKEKGIKKNFENAIEHCNGDIVFLCDHDDSWDLKKIEKHMQIYENYPDVDWVVNKLVMTDEFNNKEIGYLEDYIPNYYRHKTMLENCWGTCIGGAMTSYRRETLLKAMPIPKWSLAHDSWIQFTIYPAKPYFIDEILQKYRQHPENFSAFTKVQTDQKEILKTEREAIVNNITFIKNSILYGKITINKKVKLSIALIYKSIFFFKRIFL